MLDGRFKCETCQRELVAQLGLNRRPGNWDGATKRCEFCKTAYYFDRCEELEDRLDVALARLAIYESGSNPSEPWEDVKSRLGLK